MKQKALLSPALLSILTCAYAADAPQPFFEQGLILPDSKVQKNDLYPAAYNTPASFQIDRNWQISANASYLYWYMGQDDMYYAFVQSVINTTVGAIFSQNFGYNSGFQVGLGFDPHRDGWSVNAEYTWYHNTESQSDIAPPANSTASGGWTINSFSPVLGGPYETVSSKWSLKFDQLDLVASRPFYEGQTLTVNPSCGLRALWIQQFASVTASNPGQPNDISSANSHSWALGVVGNMNGRCMLYKGLRVDSLLGSSLLYTHYSPVSNYSNTESHLGTKGITRAPISINSMVRPTFNAGLGLGYSAYLFKNQFVFDLAARYDFNYFWAQNVAFNDPFSITGISYGDLYLHGLTVNLLVDF
jgi:hypothetical protein